MAPIITVSLPSDGDTALAEDIDDPITAILAVVNGNLDDANIASMNGSKIVAGSLPATAFSTATAQGWNAISQTPVYASNNGNHEFTATFSGVDLTTIIPLGSKFKLTRGTTAPTQSMAFTSGSSQYATNASPSNISFTGAFTCEALVYPTSYPSGDSGIISKFNSTGFILILKASGQVQLTANGSSTFATSSQSLPLNQWAHVAATFSSGTFNIYINGTLVPSATSGSSTTITQAGPLQIGAFNSTGFFNGYISEARVWSVAQTQSAIQSNMGVSLVGNETNLNCLFQGNGNFNDKTSNANNLTATGGAIATQAANPYSNTEYAIVTKLALSGSNTSVTLFSGRSNMIPNMILTNAFWSAVRTPFGFPASKGNWSIEFLILNSVAASGAAANTIYNPGGSNLNVPTGEWRLRAQMMVQVGTSGNTINVVFGASTSSTAFNPGTRMATEVAIQEANSTTGHIVVGTLNDDISQASLTPYYLLVESLVTATTLLLNGVVSSTTPQITNLVAESSYV